MPDQTPAIRILGFRTTYVKKAGMAERVARDWVKYCSAHDPKVVTEEIVSTLKPPERGEEEDSEIIDMELKIGRMTALWRIIEPAYEAWKKGTEVPLDGTPLAAWAGVTPEQIDVLRVNSIRTVQEVASMTDSQMGKIALPGMRALKQTAIEWLESRASTAQAEEIATLKEQLAMLSSMVAEQQDAAAVAEPKKRGPGRPPKITIEDAA